MSKERFASVSLDLDNKWSYLKTHGDASWESFPSYLETVVPRFLDFLDEFKIKITVFVVGQDAAIESNRPALQMIADRGHEIGNHSFHHEPWLHLYSPEELEREFERSEKAIEQATGKRTIGFRGPGFSLSDQTLRVLARRGYKYDCSTFPTYLGPLARAYYFMNSSLSKKDREDRKELFGRLSDGFQSNFPYYWDIDGTRLLEIPVTTIPVVKTPFHASYLLYLASYSKTAAQSYLWTAIKMCRLTGVNPSMLLHPLDFLGADDEQDLAFFPAMNLNSATKVKLMREFMTALSRNFDLVPMIRHAEAAESKPLFDRSIQLARCGVSF